MAKKIQENFLTSSIFLYNSYSCTGNVDDYLQYPGESPLTSLKLTSDISKPIRFAFGSKVGLVRLNNDGSAAEKNILGKLLTIDDSNIENYLDFFEKNGFLLPISNKNQDFIGEYELRIIINRLKATLELLSMLSDVARTSYEKIIRMIMYLLFSPIIHIETQEGKYKYTSSRNPYTAFLDNMDTNKRDDSLTDIFNNSTFSITDTISKYELDAQLVEDMFKGNDTEDKYQHPLYKQVFLSYCSNRNDIPVAIQNINDFLFHYFSEVGIVNQVTLEKTYYYQDIINKNNFSDVLKDTAIKIAKIILKYEIDSNLQRVKATYDIKKMEPSWKIDSLLSALYFGLFYMRPTMETYRRCANPKCNEFFLVSLSSQHKKYCCKACQNREMAARKRIRDKQLKI